MDTTTLIIVMLIVINVGGLIFSRMRKNIAKEDDMSVSDTQLAMHRAKQERFEFIGKLFASRDNKNTIERNLITAGLMLKPSEFMMVNLFVLAVVMLIGILHVNSMPAAFSVFAIFKRFLWMVGYVYIGWKAPRWILQYMANRRRTLLENQLADALTIIASGLKGGYSFVQGLDMASQQLDSPIKDETARVLRLIQLGLDTPRALLQMAERINSYDYNMTVSATNIQLAVGGNLSLMLENIAATVRERIRLRRDIGVLTAQGRISGMILICLPIAIGVMLYGLNREYMSKLLTTDVGNNILYAAGILQILGIFWIKNLLDFDK
jgi:tight adherence protein B